MVELTGFTREELEVGGRKLILVTVRGIAERGQSVTKSRLTERALASSINAIAMADLEGRLAYVNPSFLRMWGYDHEREVLGKQVVKFRQFEENAEQVVVSIEKGQGWVGELTAKRKDGSLFDAQLSAHMILEDDGSPMCPSGSFVDASKRNRAEDALRSAEREKALILNSTREMLVYYDTELRIRWANKASADSVGMDPSDVAGLRCHELWHRRGSPCEECPVQKAARSGLPQEREDVTPDGRHFFLRGYPVFDDRERVTVPIEFTLDITELKRAEAASRESEEQLRLIGETVTLTTSLEPDLDSVRMDPGQVEQVLTNLVVNARDAMPEGGEIAIETANVTLDEEYARRHLSVKAGSYVLMAVSDSGVGMDETVKSHLFEPFFTTKEKGKGTGLGLSTCYGIVEQNGGFIVVFSEVGCGA
jgi:two-component system cell cycle sensor histidine kinase/response regulator CckA